MASEVFPVLSYLGDLKSQLEDEKYDVTAFGDATYGNPRAAGNNPGEATLRNFATLKNYGIVLIYTHGYSAAMNDPTLVDTLAIEFYCDESARDAAFKVLSKDPAFSPWIVPGFESTNLCPNRPNKGFDHVIWDIAITKAGLAHFFPTDGQTSVLFIAGCTAYSMGAGLGIPAFLSYTNSVDAYVAGGDIATMFNRLAGQEGERYRDTTAAYQKGDLSPLLQMSASGAPVVLSPTVKIVDPAEGGQLPLGQTKKVYVYFQTAMDEDAKPVQVKGCDLPSTPDQKFITPTTLLVTLDVPSSAKPGAQVTLTVNHEQAKAGMPGWPSQLNGNQPDPDKNGAQPHSDYVWHLSCGSGLNINVSGQQGGKAAEGRLVGPTSTVQCQYLQTDPRYGPKYWVLVRGMPSTSGGQISFTIIGFLGTHDVNSTTPDTTGVSATVLGETGADYNVGGGSGSVTIAESSGTLDVNLTDGGSLKIDGSWTCPPGASPTP